MRKDGHIQCSRAFRVVDFSKFIGLEYKQYNCYDLVRLIYQQIQIELPIVQIANPNLISDAFVEEQNRGYWSKVQTASLGTVVTFQSKLDLPTHCGFMLDRIRMLHITKNHRSCIEKIDTPIWKGQFHGFYQFDYEQEG